MRKLATIQRIDDLQPIEGADNIVRAKIKGWNLVVQKNQFQIGDKAIYFEIDSLLPNIEQFQFLFKGRTLKKTVVNGVEKIGFRLKTVELRGAISQGLAIPLSEFPAIQHLNLPIDSDVTTMLEVHKYEAPVPACLSGEVKGANPACFPQTDEERVQNRTEDWASYQGKSFYVTEKVDGTSMSALHYEGDFNVCGHNWNYRESEKNSLWQVANSYNLRNKLPEGFVVQGELAGEGINKNRQKLKGHDLFVFYVFDIASYRYLSLEEMLSFTKDLGLKTVPVVHTDFVLSHSIEDILALSDGKSLLNPDVRREGQVYRLKGDGNKISFKVISNSYLLKHDC